MNESYLSNDYYPQYRKDDYENKSSQTQTRLDININSNENENDNSKQTENQNDFSSLSCFNFQNQNFNSQFFNPFGNNPFNSNNTLNQNEKRNDNDKMIEMKEIKEIKESKQKEIEETEIIIIDDDSEEKHDHQRKDYSKYFTLKKNEESKPKNYTYQKYSFNHYDKRKYENSLFRGRCTRCGELGHKPYNCKNEPKFREDILKEIGEEKGIQKSNQYSKPFKQSKFKSSFHSYSNQNHYTNSPRKSLSLNLEPNQSNLQSLSIPQNNSSQPTQSPQHQLKKRKKFFTDTNFSILKHPSKINSYCSFCKEYGHSDSECFYNKN